MNQSPLEKTAGEKIEDAVVEPVVAAKSLVPADKNASPFEKLATPILMISAVALLLWWMGVIGPFTDKGRIAGEWSGPIGYKIDFRGDGTFFEETALKKSEGTYRFQNGVLVLESPGLLWGTNSTEFAFKFDGSNLNLYYTFNPSVPALTVRRNK